MNKLYLDKDAAEFIAKTEAQGGKPLYELTPEEARNVLAGVQKEYTKPPADVSEINLPLGNGRNMRVILAKPEKAGDPLPVIFYIHGGGWVMGSELTHDRLIRQLAADTGAAVVFPVYELSPESQYPQTTNDLFAALRHIAENGAKYNLDSEYLVIAGDSAGGNMAAVMALMAKAEGSKPKIDFQLLFYPVTDANFETESYNQYAQGPWLTKKAMEWFWQQYAPNKDKRKEIYACPLKAQIEELAGLSPTLIITDENDVLRDEGEAYAAKLSQAGVDVCSIRVNGTIHDFLMLNELADSAPSRTTLTLAAAVIKKQFSQA